MRIDISQVDMTDPVAVQQAVKEIVEDIWANYMTGMPLAIVVNVGSTLNAALLSQFNDPNQLLYAVDKNAVAMELVIEQLAQRVGRDKMDAAVRAAGRRGDDEEAPKVLH